MDPEDPDLLVEQEGEGEPQEEDQNEIIADEWEPGEAQYQFDDEEDAMEDNTFTYQSSTIRLALDNNTATKVMAVRSKPAAPNRVAEPMYHHWSKHQMRPDRPRHNNRTLLGYWEINSVKPTAY
jgi:hypothetical protein